MGLIARPAMTADAPAPVVLVNSAYRGDSSKAGWTGSGARSWVTARRDGRGCREVSAASARFLIRAAQTFTIISLAPQQDGQRKPNARKSLGPVSVASTSTSPMMG
jgi:hypothetical protein